MTNASSLEEIQIFSRQLMQLLQHLEKSKRNILFLNETLRNRKGIVITLTSDQILKTNVSDNVLK